MATGTLELHRDATGPPTCSFSSTLTGLRHQPRVDLLGVTAFRASGTVLSLHPPSPHASETGAANFGWKA